MKKQQNKKREYVCSVCGKSIKCDSTGFPESIKEIIRKGWKVTSPITPSPGDISFLCSKECVEKLGGDYFFVNFV